MNKGGFSMKMMVLLFLLFGSLSFANQFTNIYETKAVCTTVNNVEYCYITEKADVFAVLNYQEEAGKILFHGKNYPVYTPTGKAFQNENQNGVVVWQNDYIRQTTGKEYHIMYSNDNLWFSSGWNGKTFCLVTKYWSEDKASFKDTYKFKEVVSYEKIKELSKRCLEK